MVFVFIAELKVEFLVIFIVVERRFKLNVVVAVYVDVQTLGVESFGHPFGRSSTAFLGWCANIEVMNSTVEWILVGLIPWAMVFRNVVRKSVPCKLSFDSETRLELFFSPSVPHAILKFSFVH
jgi:hypothetical protein